MAQTAVLYFLCALGMFQKGLTALIETQQTVMATVGEEARFSCQLMQPKDVLQVTWQKVSPDGDKNVATYNELFGQKVNPDFRDKVEFEYAGLQSSSIVIRNVMEQDGGCYRCLFNTYPEGALTATTCLLVYELHEPVLHVGESNAAEETVVSCWATGRPAPTVTLTVPRYNSTSVSNTNGTVTVTATAVLSRRLRDNSRQVGCAAWVPSVPQVEVFVMIPEVKPPPADDFSRWIVIVSCVCVCVCVCVAAAVACIAVYVLRKRKHQNRSSLGDSENSKTPQKTTKDAHETEKPLMKHWRELRIRMSTGGRKESDTPKASLTAGCHRKLFFCDTE